MSELIHQGLLSDSKKLEKEYQNLAKRKSK